MTYALVFLSGLVLGVIVGIFVMALCVAGGDN